MQIIDTNNPQILNELENLKWELNNQLQEKRTYEVTDFALVRTTNFLSENLLLKALCHIPFVVNTNNVCHGAVSSIIKTEYHLDPYNDEDYQKLVELTNSYSPLSTQFRKTIHFTLNGLVSSHNKGNFDNQNFIIIDPLNKHLGKDDFRSLRMEDTFIADEFQISNEAVILINEFKYAQLLLTNPWLKDNPMVVLYRGDEKIATEIILTKMGIYPEIIRQHSAEESKRTPLQQKFFQKIREQYGIEQVKHYYSKEYQEDDKKNLELWDIYDNMFYKALFDYFKIEDNRQIQLLEILTNEYTPRFEQEDVLKNFIIEVGFENYKTFITQYNKTIIDAIKTGLYPTNTEILEIGKIELKNGETPQKNKM